MVFELRQEKKKKTFSTHQVERFLSTIYFFSCHASIIVANADLLMVLLLRRRFFSHEFMNSFICAES